MIKNCPECCSQISQAAMVCPVCTQRIVGKSCPDCLTLSPQEAKVCRFCQHKFRAVNQKMSFKPFQVKADSLATLLIRWRFFPQKAEFNADKLIITSYGLFGLTSHDEEIPWEKVAGFTHHSGLFWDYISIETRGQSAAIINCLNKQNASRIRSVLQALER
ncbi:PH domain-containing protein [Neisseria sp. Ec49-e6-T10]|uniref:PH domain-containing protein n=1 Tax=Neisseria sp. Ec49-e6-T10 TaxID=3140744 RepID=UPI003EB8B8D8